MTWRKSYSRAVKRHAPPVHEHGVELLVQGDVAADEPRRGVAARAPHQRLYAGVEHGEVERVLHAHRRRPRAARPPPGSAPAGRRPRAPDARCRCAGARGRPGARRRRARRGRAPRRRRARSGRAPREDRRDRRSCRKPGPRSATRPAGGRKGRSGKAPGPASAQTLRHRVRQQNVGWLNAIAAVTTSRSVREATMSCQAAPERPGTARWMAGEPRRCA